MALFPAVQKKAQEEIDKIIGMQRLPSFDDQPALPYLEAIYRELMRWAPVFPLNTAHVSTEDDVYKGFYIPKGIIFLFSKRSYWRAVHHRFERHSKHLVGPMSIFSIIVGIDSFNQVDDEKRREIPWTRSLQPKSLLRCRWAIKWRWHDSHFWLWTSVCSVVLLKNCIMANS